jgi:hypothetical protein
MNLVYYHPIALAAEQKGVFHYTINPLISVMDRTQRTWPKFDYVNMFPMPTTLASTAPNFMDVSVARIKELTQHNQHVNVLWSGGIDSTFIMTLMIDLGIADELYSQGRLTIGLNQDSIRENPVFYEKFIKPRYINCVVQANHLLIDPKENEVIITGEMADNLVGSLTMKSCVDYYNDFGVVHQPYGKSVDWLSRKLQKEEAKTALRNFIEQTVQNSPIEIISCHDLLWYLNFNFKWQAVNFRIVSHAKDEAIGNRLIKNLKHFFNTDDFQMWSLMEGHYFEGTNWGDYKKVMKKQIYQVTSDLEYYKNKTKHPSLPALLRYKDTFDFIYEDNGTYKFTKKML